MASPAELLSRPVVLGATGQVGRRLLGRFGAGATGLSRAAGLSRAEFDLAAISETSLRGLAERKPTVLINAAAYTQVEKAEQESELAFRINGEAPGRLAVFCRERGIPLVHYSTDYVFSGELDRPWREEDPTGPLNAYGKSKLAGERAIQEAGGDYLILRTSWVYDTTGTNFLQTMLRLGREREVIRVVRDQFGTPTYAPSLADATISILEKCRASARFPSGVYHLCSQGETSWHGFAEAIFAELSQQGPPLKVKQVEAILSEEYPNPLPRPKNSRLDCAKAFAAFGIRLPDWRQDLRRCLTKIG